MFKLGVDPLWTNRSVCVCDNANLTQHKSLHWYWIKCSLNIADCFTRTNFHIGDINELSMWQIGDEFMKFPIPDWPITAMKDVTAKIPERKTQSGSISMTQRGPSVDNESI